MKGREEMKTGKIVLIDVLDDPPFNITEIFKSVLESAGIDSSLIAGVSGLDETLSIPQDVKMVGAIISGSVHHVIEDDNKKWGRSLFRFIRQHYNRIPILGVCYGHQALAFALGGDVEANKQGREVGTTQIFLTDEAQTDKLFFGFDSVNLVQESHLDHVVTLPKGAILLAYSRLSANQAFRIEKSWGIQFHPELTPSLFSRLLKGRAESLVANAELEEAGKLKKAIAEIKDCPMAIEVLKRFILHCMEEGK